MGQYGAAVHKCKFLGVNMLWPAILIMCSVFNRVDGSSEDVDGPNADIHTHRLSASFLNPRGLRHVPLLNCQVNFEDLKHLFL